VTCDRVRARYWVIATVFIALFSVGCSAELSAARSPVDGVAMNWVLDIRSVRESSQSELERRILEDYYVSDAELQEARSALAACLNNHGVQVIFQPDDSRAFIAELGTPLAALVAEDEEQGFAALSSIASTCERETIGMVEFFHRNMRDNPEGLTTAEMRRRCLERYGLPDGLGLSDDQFNEWLSSADFRPSSAQAMLCITDPLGTDGFTLTEAEEMLQHLDGTLQGGKTQVKFEFEPPQERMP